jgi:hypothetical protein
MILLKRIDVYGQFILILLCTALTLIFHSEVFLICLFIIGFWQVVSTSIQMFFNKNKVEVHGREAYQKFLVVSILTLPIGSFWVLPFIAPFAAIWYFAISRRELRIWEARQLIQFR